MSDSYWGGLFPEVYWGGLFPSESAPEVTPIYIIEAASVEIVELEIRSTVVELQYDLTATDIQHAATVIEFTATKRYPPISVETVTEIGHVAELDFTSDHTSLEPDFEISQLTLISEVSEKDL